MKKIWKPKVLTEYAIGRSMSAIDAVTMLGKPIAEVMSCRAKLCDLESDLRECIKLAGKKEEVHFWIRKSGPRFRYGFYKEPWALKALDFIDHARLSRYNHEWISGLVFGYRPELIQKFLSKKPKR